MEFERVYNQLLYQLLNDSVAIDRGEWHAKDVAGIRKLMTFELRNTSFEIYIPPGLEALREDYQPNLPWADDHFDERISGEPLNPPPSHEWWPFAMKGNETHLKQGAFSHSYPERYWPRAAMKGVPPIGIRFEWGDLDDLIELLKERPLTRQAYLPIWFPEDLTAARQRERCPCSLGYHFLLNEHDELDVSYFIRSCDFVRHFRDDMYLTARLCQWVVKKLEGYKPGVRPGNLYCTIPSLHCMQGDLARMEEEYENLAR